MFSGDHKDFSPVNSVYPFTVLGYFLHVELKQIVEIHVELFKNLVLESHLRDNFCLQMYALVATNHMVSSSNLLVTSKHRTAVIFQQSTISLRLLDSCESHFYIMGPIQYTHCTSVIYQQFASNKHIWHKSVRMGYIFNQCHNF